MYITSRLFSVFPIDFTPMTLDASDSWSSASYMLSVVHSYAVATASNDAIATANFIF
jgi:hypothetical protein